MKAAPPAQATILVVDDERTNRDLLARVLGQCGYEVVTVTDDEAALRALATVRPDVILLDVEMPGIDGFEVCRRIKQRPQTRLTPVVLVTGLKAPRPTADGSRTTPMNRNARRCTSHPIQRAMPRR